MEGWGEVGSGGLVGWSTKSVKVIKRNKLPVTK